MNDTLVVQVLTQAVVYGTPILFAALGELLAERSGVLNLGVEGMMLIGAVMGFWAMQHSSGPEGVALPLAVLTAAFAGMVVSSILAFLAITLRASQIVSGLALTIFCGGLGLASYLGNDLGLADVPPKHQFSDIDVFGLKDVPVAGPVLFHQSALVYLSWVFVLLISLYLMRTRIGLNTRAIGEAPGAADAMGISVPRYRYAHVLAGGALAGIGGACYSLGDHAGVDGRRLAGRRRRLDRDCARDLRLLATGAVPRRRVPVRRAGRRAPLGAAGARVQDQARGAQRAAVHHDYRRARDRLDWARPATPRRARRARHPVRPRGALMEVVSPRSLDEALRVKSEHPDAVPIQGGTDVMVELNFDRRRPEVLLNLNEVPELRGWSRENGSLRLASGLTYAEAMEAPLAELLPALAEASRTVGSPQIRNRGTLGGNLGTASPAGDALPPLLVEEASVELASVRGVRTMPLRDFLVGPKRNAAEPDELIAAVRVSPSGAPQTFMKVGPRNAMVIAVCSLAVVADRERGELRASFGSAGPVAGLVSVPLDEAASFADRVAAAASPIDDVRGTAAYRRHALHVLATRALERCLG